jgi:hypothetical protein
MVQQPAWIIVEGHKRVPNETVVALRELTAGLIEDEHMPICLDECIERRPSDAADTSRRADNIISTWAKQRDPGGQHRPRSSGDG